MSMYMKMAYPPFIHRLFTNSRPIGAMMPVWAVQAYFPLQSRLLQRAISLMPLQALPTLVNNSSMASLTTAWTTSVCRTSTSTLTVESAKIGSIMQERIKTSTPVHSSSNLLIMPTARRFIMQVLHAYWARERATSHYSISTPIARIQATLPMRHLSFTQVTAASRKSPASTLVWTPMFSDRVLSNT